MFLDGLVSSLSAHFSVIAAIHSTADLLDSITALPPEVAVVDAVLVGSDPRGFFQRLRSSGAKIVVLLDQNHSFDAALFLECGADACVSKQAAVAELVAAIHQVLGTDGGVRTMELSAREIQVLRLLAQGRTFKEAATQLGVSPRTIEFHRYNISRKTGVHTTAELARLASRMKLVADHERQLPILE
jgi:DNA-binding NarL/FixJ family response regulator